MTRRAEDSDGRVAAATPAASPRPVAHRMPEDDFRRMRGDFARIGLPLGPPQLHEEALRNVCLAVFRLNGRLLCSHWRDDLTEIDDPALAGALDIVALHADADARGLPRGTAARDAFLVYGIATALNAALEARHLGGPLTVERFDGSQRPTRRDYLEGALFTAADHAAGRRAMRVVPAHDHHPGAPAPTGLFVLEEL